MKISKKIKSVLKIIVCLSLSFVLMSALTLSVFATITEQRFSYYTTYTYTDEPILPRSYALGRGGDVLYETYNAMNYGSFTTADPIRITTIGRDITTGKISSIKMEFTNIDYWYIYVHNDGDFHINVHDTKESDYTTFYSAEVYSIDDTKTRFAKFDWDNVIVTCPDIKKGDTFTYYDLQKNLQTIIFDGNGGIVGYGNSNEDDNPFGDLTEQEYPDFNLPKFQGKELSEYVDFDSIIESIKGLDVAGAVQGLLGALKGGFKFTVDSVVNVVGYLTSTLKALFDWLKNTLPVLFNNFLVKLSPYFEKLYNVIKDSPVGETLTDLTELYSKLDDLKASLISVLPEPIQNVINSIPDKIAEIKEKIETVANNILSIKDTIIDRVQTIIDNIKDIPNRIDDFKEYFLSLFDTTDIDLSARVDDVKQYAFSKFPILSTISGLYSDIDTMLSSFNREPPVIVFPTSEVFGGEDVTVSLGFLRPVIAITDVIIVAACYLLTLIYSIRALPNIIGGIGSGTSDLVNSFSSSAPTFEQLTFFDDK
ncbi:MAG: hypothetical protein IKL70_03095 [Oscillospiraceae bacterium]|nr:hypothetical protein [Oscillospiraceae bacterium]